MTKEQTVCRPNVFTYPDCAYCWSPPRADHFTWIENMKPKTKRRDCPTHQTKSRSRSSTLKGRTSPNKGKSRGQPRQSVTVGLTPRPKPDPTKKPWPRDCVTIVAATPATLNVRGITGTVTDQICAECTTRLAVDSDEIARAWAMPERQGRPLRFICVKCFVQYDRSSIERLIDRRTTRGTNEGNLLDE